MTDDSQPTHTVSIEIRGHYPHGHIRPHATVMLAGDGGIEHMLTAARMLLVAAGFGHEVAARLRLVD